MPETQKPQEPRTGGVTIDTPLAVGAVVIGALAVLTAIRVGFAGALAKAVR